MKLAPDGTTVRTMPHDARANAAAPTAYLTIALDCSRLDAGPRRCTLTPGRRLTVGRANAPSQQALSSSEFFVGIPDSRLSRGHATLAQNDQRQWELADLGSTNGTFRNGERIQRVSLNAGDVIQCGRTIMLFHLSPVACSEPVVEPTRQLPLGFTTLSPAYAKALVRLRGVARSGLPILLLGESGTGKEVTARAIHELAGRPGPLIPVNCGALAPALAEAQLFGHVRGAFTGAAKDEQGFLRAAHFGTLLLDEVAELSPAHQVLLLRVLQEREVTPVGSVKSQAVDVRIVAATNRPLLQMVETGTFRQDLYARLSGYVHELPPLRDRLEDLGWLIAIWQRASSDHGHALRELRPELAYRLFRYSWPLNIRELFHGLERALAVAGDEPAGPEHWTFSESAPPPSPARVAPALSPAELRLQTTLIRLLEEHQGNLAAVGRSMGKARQQIQRWVRRFGLDVERYR